MPSRRNRLLACSLFAKHAQAFELNCWPNMSAISNRCSFMNLLMFVCAFNLFQCQSRAWQGQNTCPRTLNISAQVSCHRLFCQADIAQELACKPQMQGRPMTVIFLPQLRVASTSCFTFGKIIFLSWSPWQTIHAPQRLLTLFLMLIMNSHYLAFLCAILLGLLLCPHP
jgi:hypothetical protein